MNIEITSENRKSIERIQREFSNQLSEKNILKATKQGINATLKKSIVKIKKQVTSEYNITKKYLDRTVVISPYASDSRLYGGIKINVAPLPIVAFKPKETKSGVSFAARKGKTEVVHSAFLATLSSGHKGVFARGEYKGKKFVFGNATTASGKVRVTQLHSSSPFSMGTTKSVAEEVKAFMSTEIMARVEGILKDKVRRIAASNK